MAAAARTLPLHHSIGSALGAVARELATACVESPRLDARLLVAAATGASHADLIAHPERILSDDEQARLSDMTARRAARMPLAQIVGRREFWSLEFAVSGDVLTPRPDSETVIEAVGACFPDKSQKLRVLDLGTGSGCLLLAVLHEYRQASGIGIDRSAAAARLAADNAENLGMAGRAQFVVGDWAGALAGAFDIILSNPPYIPSGDIDALEAEVARYEPRAALDGGGDGLAAYRSLMPVLGGLLTPDGRVFMELGAGQGEAVTRLAGPVGLKTLEIRADLAGTPRVSILCRL